MKYSACIQVWLKSPIEASTREEAEERVQEVIEKEFSRVTELTWDHFDLEEEKE